MKKYLCIPAEKFEDDEAYALVPLRQQDMEDIRLWRNDQILILRQQQPISKEHQQKYYHDAIEPLFHSERPSQILFSFLKNNKCIGYGGLTYLDWTALRGEISFLVETNRAKDLEVYRQDYLHFLELLKQVAFDVLDLHRIFAETFSFRKHHMTILEEAGFVLEGTLREHIFKQSQWYDAVIHGLLTSDVK